MKTKLILICSVVAMSLFLFACSSVPKQASVDVSCDDFMANNHISKEVQVATDGTLTITLCSNPTTGFTWSETAEISDQTVLQQTAHESVPPEETGVVGAPGQEVWTFKALKKGTSTVSLQYSRPWEGGEQGEWTFTLTVTVK